MQIDTGNAFLTFLDGNIILVETKEGVLLEKNSIKEFYTVVERELSGDYSLVINRKFNYKLMRFEVYSEANSHPRLRGIAIVTHKKAAGVMAEMEGPLCRKPFATFADLDAAVAWANRLHEP